MTDTNDSPLGTGLDLSALTPEVAETAAPFFEKVMEAAGELLSSITVVGSAVTPDYRPGVSDINSVLVLKRIELSLLDSLSRLGRKSGPKGIEAPLLMTPEYIERSLDVFPLEFLSFRTNHVTVYGSDPFADLAFEKADVRLAVERELKSLLVNMRRGYIRCLGDKALLRDLLLASLNSLVPVFDGILYLKNTPVPAGKSATAAAAAEAGGIGRSAFDEVLALRQEKSAPPFEQLQATFKEFYDAVETTSRWIDRT